MSNNLTFGTDPEFMLVYEGQYVHAQPFVLGSKDERIKRDRSEFFYDNVMAECSVPPASSRGEAIENIRETLRTYALIVSPAKLVAQASEIYSDEAIYTHESAQEGGCASEIDAYDCVERKPDQSLFINGKLRTAGGHIHLGHSVLMNPATANCATKILDLFVGVPSIFLDRDPTSARRREMYGKAGRFRETKYGLEYRTIGNFWLRRPQLVGLIYDLCEFTVEFIQNGYHKELWFVDDSRFNAARSARQPDFDYRSCFECRSYATEPLRTAIETMDRVEGGRFLEMISRFIPHTLMGAISDEMNATDSSDLYKEWDLT